MATKRQKRAAAEAGALLRPAVIKLLANEVNFDSAALLSAIIDQWGGPKELAASLFVDYNAAKAGSMTRQRIVEMISRLTVQVTNQGQANIRDESSMSDQEIEEEIMKIVAATVAPKEYDRPEDRPDA